MIGFDKLFSGKSQIANIFGFVCVLVCSGCHSVVPQIGWLKQQKFFSHSSGNWKSKVRIPYWRAHSVWLVAACFSLYPHLEVGPAGDRAWKMKEQVLWCLFL